MTERPTPDEIRRVRRWECHTAGEHTWEPVLTVSSLRPTAFLCANCGEQLRVVAEAPEPEPEPEEVEEIEEVHETIVIAEPLGEFTWRCTCGKRGGAYFFEQNAEGAARGHEERNNP